MKNQFAEFNKLIENQFRYGGEKYKSTSNKEATDELFDAHSYRGLMFTIDKYTYRFKNLQRERDLLKISAYMYIVWLKRGFHFNSIGSNNPINTTVDIKSKYFTDFILSTYNYYENNRFYVETLLTEDALQKISNTLKSFSAGDWQSVAEHKLLHIYCLSFVIWNNKYFDTGKAGSDTDTENETKNLYNILLTTTTEFFKDTEFGEIDLDVLVKHQVEAITKKRN